MIARELLVKLGFDIDESKLNRFNNDVEALKNKMAGLKPKLAIDIDQQKLDHLTGNVKALKSKMADLKPKIAIEVDQQKLNRFAAHIETLKNKMTGLKSRLGFDIDKKPLTDLSNNLGTIKKQVAAVKSKLSIDVDQKPLTSLSHNLATIKKQMADLKAEINQQLHPQINTVALANYQKEIKYFRQDAKNDLLELNKAEKDAEQAQLNANRLKYKQLQAINTKLKETQRSFQRAAATAKQANLAFSRYFTRFALIGAGSALLTIRKTLKDAQNFKTGGKTNNVFSKEQLNTVDRFNISLRTTQKTLGEMRNKFVVDLLPAFKEHLDSLNQWLTANKELINDKVKKFMDTLGKSLRMLSSAISVVFNVLTPLANLIGGWGTVLTGMIGLGIISWLVRLAIFLKQGSSAVILFSVAVRALTVALMTNPICLILMAVVAALVLIADEFIVTAKGGDSLMNRFSGLKKVVYDYVDALKAAWAWLVKVKDNMFEFTIGGFDKVKDFFSGVEKVQKEIVHVTEGGLKMYRANESRYHRQDADNDLQQNYAGRGKAGIINNSNSIHNHNSATSNPVTVTKKQNFNMTINVPKGTTKQQTIIIANEVQKHLKADREFSQQKTLHAIGPS